MSEARRVLRTIAERYGHDFTFDDHLIGGASIDALGERAHPLVRRGDVRRSEVRAILSGGAC